MTSAIAIVGMACCFPDARTPQELWENVLAQRRAFRRFPEERLPLSDYFSPDTEALDAIYARHAAVIDGYEFDRVRFRVAGPTFRSVDLTHWLALDVADKSLQDAGFANGEGLPTETTGVLVGNSLTGEFSRAASLRLRWPYIRRIVEAQLHADSWEPARISDFLWRLEKQYKSPFPEVGEETLAGSLSNTIAGRICNHFHFGGGGYTVDGACSSSLLGVAKACSALQAGELDAALCGGVDLSLDPFELVGFSKVGALSHGEMLVYDKNSDGFLPGEGCGFVVLLRLEDALSRNLRIYATVRGWGISSDGVGGITRPDIHGQVLALRRAYQRANYGIHTVALFEGHGTGTPVGDEVELSALSELREEEGSTKCPAAIGSIKANFGHTKAAAGIAGLIKAALAVEQRVLPPTTGVRNPRPEVAAGGSLRVLSRAEIWPSDLPLRAGINSFGFGGINVHIAIEGREEERCSTLPSALKLGYKGVQDAEVFLFDADSLMELGHKIEGLTHRAENLSQAELTDLSMAVAKKAGRSRVRACVIASSPEEFELRIRELRTAIDKRTPGNLNFDSGVFLASGISPPRIGFLFPGQASPVRLDSGIHGQFDEVASVYRMADLPNTDDGSTEVAQLAIATAELAGFSLFEKLGVSASVAVGHSLGELTAYFWAKAFDDKSLLQIVRARGAAMSRHRSRRGAMASIGANAGEVASLFEREEVIGVACINSVNQTVVSGEAGAVASVVERARRKGWTATVLSTADAFHSRLLAEAANRFRDDLSSVEVRPFRKRVISSITGVTLSPHADWRSLLIEQLTHPVQFMQAVTEAAADTDLFVEVGPGSVLANLVRSITQVPVVSLDMGGSSMKGLLKAFGAAFVLGEQTNCEPLFADRFTRKFDFGRRPKFFVNPCEVRASEKIHTPIPPTVEDSKKRERQRSKTNLATLNIPSDDAIGVVRNLVAAHTELPPEAIPDSARFLSDLHLNSIVVGEMVANAAQALHVPPPAQVLEFANASVGELSERLEQLKRSPSAPVSLTVVPAGIEDWCRAFVVNWRPAPLRSTASAERKQGQWKFFGPRDHPWSQLLSRTSLPGDGTLVCIPEGSIETQMEALVAGARHTIGRDAKGRRLVVLGSVEMAGAFVRTVSLENPDIQTLVLEIHAELDVARCLLGELSTNCAYVAARYDPSGTRYERVFEELSLGDQKNWPIHAGDTVLVTGGAKGIAAECTYELAKESGARLVLLGRSPGSDPSVTNHLRRLVTAGIEATYIQADVSCAHEVRAAVEQVEKMHGPIAAIIHGAGTNQPALLDRLSDSDIHEAVAPKVKGFRNLIESIDPSRLRLLVTFSSVIGRVGLDGEAHYALANSSLSALTVEFASRHPQCRSLALESSAWSGVGMAERLGKLDELRQAGVSPITPAEGVAWFIRLVAQKLPATSVVLTGRLGAIPPIPIADSTLPLHRFLEKPLVHYPGIELVSDCELTTISDPYLRDHVFQGKPLLPAVMGVEAMVAAAMGLSRTEKIPAVEGLRFDHPIVIDPSNRVTLRIVALRRGGERVDVAIRSSQTSFQLNHFRCSCVFKDEPLRQERFDSRAAFARIALEPQSEMYGGLLFQGPRFQQLKGYRRLTARFSCAEISSSSSAPWFTPYLPGQLILGDPASRDAALHSIQACVPDEILLPLSVERIEFGLLNPTEVIVARATELWHEAGTYCYDLELRSADGSLRELWHSLRFRKVADAKTIDLPDALMAVLLERRLRKAELGLPVALAFERDKSMDRRSRTKRAIQRALNAPYRVHWREDGKPEVDAPFVVSAAHSNGLTLAVAAQDLVACDLESVELRPEKTWRDMLGAERWMLARLISNQAQEDLDTAATRVWTAMESLAKVSQSQPRNLVLSSSPKGDGVVSLSSSDVVIATSVLRFRGDSSPLGVAILTRTKPCVNMNIATESVSKRQIS